MQTSGSGEWYLSRDGQSHGPVTDLELRKIAELGHLKPTDYVWREGYQDWLPAGEVPGLLGLRSPQAPGMAPPFAMPRQAPQGQVAGEAGGHLAPHGEAPGGDRPAQASQGTGLALASYILLIIPLPLLTLIGLIIAVVNINAQPEWVATHYRWQWRTVVKGFLLFMAGLLVSFTGALVFPPLWLLWTPTILGVLVWTLVRHIRGIVALNRQQPIPNVHSWGW